MTFIGLRRVTNSLGFGEEKPMREQRCRVAVAGTGRFGVASTAGGERQRGDGGRRRQADEECGIASGLATTSLVGKSGHAISPGDVILDACSWSTQRVVARIERIPGKPMISSMDFNDDDQPPIGPYVRHLSRPKCAVPHTEARRPGSVGRAIRSRLRRGARVRPARSAIMTGCYPTAIGTMRMRTKAVPPAGVRLAERVLPRGRVLHDQQLVHRFPGRETPPTASGTVPHSAWHSTGRHCVFASSTA